MAEIYNIDFQTQPEFLAQASCAFGVFDGIHTGHRYLLDAAQQTAQEHGGLSVALTFDIDPDEVFHANRLKKLLSNKDRIEMLAQTGVDAVGVLPFTREFAAAGPLEFLERTFGNCTPAFIHIGHDFRFGAKASGTVATLQDWAEESRTTICSHHLVSADGKPITATRIRLLLLDGNVEEANKLLGYPYTLKDKIVPGRGEGKAFGFATANMEIAANKRVLAEGVYGGWALVDGVKYRAAISVGTSPLFQAESSANIEVHILDYEGNLYGQSIAIQFMCRIRPLIQFATTEELIACVLDNIEWIRTHIPLEGVQD